MANCGSSLTHRAYSATQYALFSALMALPGKPLLELAGKPMIAYAIEAARQCGLFEHVVVSTDDDEIAQVAHDNAASTEQVSAAMEEQSAVMNDLARAARGLTAMSEDMMRCIERFRTSPDPGGRDD